MSEITIPPPVGAPEFPHISGGKLKIFLLGALWAVCGGLIPVGTLLWDWISRWSDPPDWTMVIHQAVLCSGLALIGYWRKYKAWLMQPPEGSQNSAAGAQGQTTTG